LPANPKPTRADRAAVQSFVRPLQQAIYCISYTKILQGDGERDGESALTLPDRWVRLQHPAGLHLSLIHAYTVSSGVVHTTTYYYDIADGDLQPVVQFHWHPGTRVDYPHIQVRSRTGLVDVQGRHIPSGRVSFESVVRFLIDELKVDPVPEHAATWRDLLDQNEEQFLTSRSWHTRPGI
jgi:hypothetical protein